MNFITRLVALIMLLSMSVANGATSTKTTAKFHGTLIVVECSLNAGKGQTVDFGDAVGIHRIDGKRYEQSVPFNLDCKNHAGGEVPAMTLTLSGNPSSFNLAAVSTNVDGLAIELRVNGVAQPLNKTISLDYNHLPSLTAVPVVDNADDLEAQPFNSSVKLIVEVP